MKIILSGGGTMGSVSPLIEIVAECKRRNLSIDWLWVGTKTGPEKDAVEKATAFGGTEAGIRFQAISSGRFRRFLSWKNITDLGQIWKGFWETRKIIREFKPDLVLTAGSFVCVPVAFVSYFEKVPVWLHQQDVLIGLANKLMSRVASKITVVFEKSVDDFIRGGVSRNKIIVTGNPVRQSVLIGNHEKALEKFGFSSDLPVIGVVGGGTGALAVSELIVAAAPALLAQCQILHVTGQGRVPEGLDKIITSPNASRYKSMEFCGEMENFYAASDIVVSRAGMGTLTELAALHKPVIIIPIPHFHQTDNAKILQKTGAAVVLDQEKLTPEILTQQILSLFKNKPQCEELGEKLAQTIPFDGTKSIVDLIMEQMV